LISSSSEEEIFLFNFFHGFYEGLSYGVVLTSGVSSGAIFGFDFEAPLLFDSGTFGFYSILVFLLLS